MNCQWAKNALYKSININDYCKDETHHSSLSSQSEALTVSQGVEEQTQYF